MSPETQTAPAPAAAPSPTQSLVRINSAMLIMGPTGSGKSALLATLFEWVYDVFGLTSRLYTTDGGGFPTRIQGLMQKGICEVWRLRTRDLPDGSLSFETCLRAAQGWWPRRLHARTGACPPGEALVPPITERYEMHCPNGHLVKTVPFQQLLTPAMCGTCRVHTTKQNMRVTKTAHPTRGFEKVGAVAFDGMSSMLSWMLSDMGQRAGRLELKGEEGAIGGKIISGDLKLGGNTRSHVGFAQSRAEELSLNSLSIPNLVHPPVWTALIDEATDDGGLSIKGPKLAGHARTADGPSWFGDCLETMVIKDDKDRRIFRLCLSEFIDDAGARHLCKNRADPGMLPATLDDPPIDGNEKQTAFTQFNLGVFRQLLDSALEKTLEGLGEKYPNAPGVAEGWVEVGEGTAILEAPAGEGEPATAAPAAPAAQTAPAAAQKAPAAPRAPSAPAAPRAKGAPAGKPIAAKPAAPVVAAPAAPAVDEAELPPQESLIAEAPAPVAQVAPAAPQQAASAPRAPAPAPTPPAGARPAWAPPAAGRPPAAGPRFSPRPAAPKP